jgi:DNA polymerase/3'-5' exonuclease PolX
MNMLLLAGNQICTQKGQDKSRSSIHNLHGFGKMYDLQIATNKTKVMAFKRKLPVISKISIHNNIQEQVSRFSFVELI